MLDLHEALERARGLASAGRWQDVKLVLGSVRGELGGDAAALYLYAEACCRMNDLVPARAAAEQALLQFGEAGDAAGRIKAATLLGIILFDAGELSRAQGCFHEALHLAMAEDDALMVAALWNNLGTTHTLQNDFADAHRCHEEALSIYRSRGEKLGEAQALHNLGIAARDQRRWAEADQFFAEAARAAQGAGDQQQFAFAMVERAHIALQADDLATAERVARLALLRFDAQGSLFGLAEVHLILARVARRQGRVDEALQLLDKARSNADLAGAPLIIAEIELERGRALADKRETDTALAAFRASLAAFQHLGRRQEAAEAEALILRLAS